MMWKIRRRWVLLLGCGTLAGSLAFAWRYRQPDDSRIIVDTATTFQRITGWEATAFAFDTAPDYEAFRDEVFRVATEDLGITRARIEVRAGSESDRDYFADYLAGHLDEQAWRSKRYATVNDNNDPNSINWAGFSFSELDHKIERVLLPWREQAARAGQRLHVNLCYVAFTRQITGSGRYHHDDPREYGEFIEAVWRHLHETYGWVPDSLEIVLEPDNSPPWNGRLIGLAIVEVARRLRAAGFAVPAIVAPSTTSMSAAVRYFDDMLRVRGVSDLLTELSYHRYRSVSRLTLQAIQARARKAGIGAAMLEWIGASYETLHEDLKLGENVAWSQYTLAGPPPDARSKYLVVEPPREGQPRVRLTDRSRYLQQYFRYIRPGALRLGAQTAAGTADAVAFRQPDGTVVVVAIGRRSESVTIAGLPPGTYGATYTSPIVTRRELPDAVVTADGEARFILPQPGVLTVFGRPARPESPAP